MTSSPRHDYQASYDLVADEYARRNFDELDRKPLDRQLLDRFADSVRGAGPVGDIGCGPGHVTHYLHQRALEVCGIDLSPAMVEQARALVPGVEFRQGDMTSLDLNSETLAGITAFYSIIHLPPADLPRAFSEFHRVLRPGGKLLLAFHIGDEGVHLDEWWGQKVNVDFFWFQPHDIADKLRTAGFEIEEIIERDPYPDLEYKTRRAYVFAHRPKMSRVAG